jgi:flagellar basal-body rod protein FlgB
VFSDLGNSGALPALEAMMRFAGARQRLISHNIANISTPGFIQNDVSVPDFQRSLADAIESRRSDTSQVSGSLQLRSKEVEILPDGTMFLNPETPSGGILYHDRNNRSVENLMKDNAENMGAFRIASELLRSRLQQLRDAIAERVA